MRSHLPARWAAFPGSASLAFTTAATAATYFVRDGRDDHGAGRGQDFKVVRPAGMMFFDPTRSQLYLPGE